MALIPDDTKSSHLDTSARSALSMKNGAEERASERAQHDAHEASSAEQSPARRVSSAIITSELPGANLDEQPAPTSRSDDALLAVTAMLKRMGAYLRRPSNLRYVTVLSISVIALVMSLVNFGLITGSIRIPTPGLRTQGETALKDTSTYGFEYDTDGWKSRGAATSAVWNNIHTFAGQGALEIQVTDMDQSQKAFAYITVPPNAKPGSVVTAHLYVPSGAPPMVATLYALDGSWTWSSGAFPALNPGTWTAITYSLPTNLASPIRELGVMVVGVAGSPPYTGVMFLDSVNIQR